MAALKTFLLSPVYRSVAFAGSFTMFIVHDWWVMPYKHNFLNIVQLTSSVFLLLVTICNNPASMSYVGDVMSIPHIGKYVII